MSVQEVKAAILEDMVRLGKEGGLKSFEQVQQSLKTQLRLKYLSCVVLGNSVDYSILKNFAQVRDAVL